MRLRFVIPSIATVVLTILVATFKRELLEVDWFGLPSGLYFVAAPLIATAAIAWFLNQKREIDVSFSWFAIAVSVTSVAAILVVAAWGKYFYDASKGPLLWTYNPSNYPIASSRNADGLWVSGFAAEAHNRSDNLVVVSRAFVTSHTSKRVINLITFAQTVEPGQKLRLFKALPPTDPRRSEGISVEAFRQEFGSFTFTAEYDGMKEQKLFSSTEVNRILAKSEAIQKQAAEKAAKSMLQ